MKHSIWITALLFQLPQIPAATAQTAPKAAATAAPVYPAGVKVRKRKTSFYYANARGMTLYALNARIAFSRSDGARDKPYCSGPCTKIWTELAAPRDAPPVGDWKVVTGAAGTPIWSYKNKPVFTYNADKHPGDTTGDAYEDLWDVIVHVPPAPGLTAPAIVAPLYVEGSYVLADSEGHALFTGACKTGCVDWTPLRAGIAARPVGDWAIARDGPQAQWTHRGQPVFVSQEDKPGAVPAGGQILRP